MKADPAATGSHAKHAQGDANYVCALCHNGYTEALYANETHANKSINLIFSGSAAGTAYSQGNTHDVANGYGTCSAAACHGSTSPAWGTDFTGIDSCTRCHGTPTADPAPAYVVAPNLDAHQNHMNPASMYGYISSVGCNECHSVPGTALTAGHIADATPGIAEISFGPKARLNSVTPTYSAGTCSVYCHGVAMPEGTTDGANRTPSWGDAAYLTGVASHDCAQCHGYPPAGIGPHTNKGPNDCHNCHNNVNATGTGFTAGGIAAHIDGQIE
jgi:predicted CxxxxCH...CXXCH cytochrome family protein